MCFAISHNPLRRLAQGATRTFLPATSRKSRTYKKHAPTTKRKGHDFHQNPPTHFNNIFAPKKQLQGVRNLQPYEQGAILSHPKAKPDIGWIKFKTNLKQGLCVFYEFSAPISLKSSRLSSIFLPVCAVCIFMCLYVYRKKENRQNP